MNTTIARHSSGAAFVAAIATAANATTLGSSALNTTQTQSTRTKGVFELSGDDDSTAVYGVTTTVVSVLNAGIQKMRSVSAANGMDLTYDFNVAAFRYDASAGNHLILSG